MNEFHHDIGDNTYPCFRNFCWVDLIVSVEYRCSFRQVSCHFCEITRHTQKTHGTVYVVDVCRTACV